MPRLNGNTESVIKKYNTQMCSPKPDIDLCAACYIKHGWIDKDVEVDHQSYHLTVVIYDCHVCNRTLSIDDN